jgi:hypothetical protein
MLSEVKRDDEGHCYRLSVDISDADLYAFGIGDVRPATVTGRIENG